MEELNDFTLKQVTDYLINKLADEKRITKSLARKLFINALSYNVVSIAIEEQVDFLMGKEIE